MPNILDNIKKQQEIIRDNIDIKIKSGTPLTDYEVANYPLKDEDIKIMNVFKDMANGREIPGFQLKDFLSTPQAQVLIPRVIIGTMKKTADPIYLASAFYKPVKLKSGFSMIAPSIGVMRAYDVGEGQEIPQEEVDWNTQSNSVISVGKSGLRLQFSDEVISDSEWDIISLSLQEAGRAMARHKEQKAFLEWKRNSWKIIDNNYKKIDPKKYANAGSTGVDFYNNLNDTMSIDDFLDLIIACYNNGYTPTDLVMHSLAWPSFARNGLTGVYSALQESKAVPESPNASFKIGPESIGGRLPFSFNINLSPFAPFDKDNKTFDMYVVDRNNVGIIAVKDKMSTEEFRDPARDLHNVKVIERYGYFTQNQGRAVCSAQNISTARSFGIPNRVYDISK